MKKIFLIYSSILIASCSHPPQQQVASKTQLKTVNRIIYNDRLTDSSTIFQEVMHLRNVIGGLDTLENGYSGIQFRFWLETRPLKVITLKSMYGNWIAELQTIAFEPSENWRIAITRREIEYAYPKIGWKRFIDSLVKLNIYGLPNGNSIPEMWNTDPHAVNIEVATDTTYKFVSFQGTHNFKEKFQVARDVEGILSLIKNQLGWGEENVDGLPHK